MNLLDLILVRLELGQYSIMHTGISVLFVLCLFSQFCLVFPLPGFSGREASWPYIGV